jgi:uncharacterized protein (TIGR02444 family)
MAETSAFFWSFSLSFYDQPGVSAAAIALQDRHGRDVNIVLYACWLGLSGRGRLDAADLARAEAVSAPWRDGVVEKLRQGRRAIKQANRDGSLSELYEAAKAVELGAERMAQRRLAALAPAATARSPAARAADAAASLTLYLGEKPALATATPIFAAIATSA